MKRNMDLVRAILLVVESDESGYAPRKIDVPGYTDEQISYHNLLLIEAGLAEGSNVTSLNSPSPSGTLSRLTWAGHEFIESARPQRIWDQAKEIMSKSGSASFQVWLAVLTELVKKNVGL